MVFRESFDSTSELKVVKACKMPVRTYLMSKYSVVVEYTMINGQPVSNLTPCSYRKQTHPTHIKQCFKLTIVTFRLS